MMQTHLERDLSSIGLGENRWFYDLVLSVSYLSFGLVLHVLPSNEVLSRFEILMF